MITGAQGQLGRDLQDTAPKDRELVALDRSQLDICDESATMRCLEAHRPDLVINGAAYTAVDKAETASEQAFAVNEQGAANLAKAVGASGARLIHISTDFVFSGTANTAYTPDARTHPLNIYGASKRAGEQAILHHIPDRALIVRTSWLYSVHGANFVKTMLKLMASRDQLSVVADQLGTPCWAKGLAHALWRLAEKPQNGILHWSDAGVASWYDFAVAIMEEGLALGLLDHPVPVSPIKSVDYPTPARRPAFSVLDSTEGWQKSATTPVHWRTSLRQMLCAFSRQSAPYPQK
ncbi:NAD(P)-dependent oxidoreductase [Iodidimonas muriae]|uniref:dTDP-4-dehydrorhamnose reductase n=2 Tax=Iodidimonas muriae TaxID=261467 RepID=A0ABQ2LBN9_9PROT|nr:NAD(P)-dependent oxidoreductase [Iodidimonas muriae]